MRSGIEIGFNKEVGEGGKLCQALILLLCFFYYIIYLTDNYRLNNPGSVPHISTKPERNFRTILFSGSSRTSAVARGIQKEIF